LRALRRSGPTRSACYGNSCARLAFAVRGARNVLTWLMFGLAIWLAVGALTAQLFGAFVSGGCRSWERDEDDQDASSSTVSDNQSMHQLLAPSLPLGANSHTPRLDDRVT
jgi:hypothetical protein